VLFASELPVESVLRSPPVRVPEDACLRIDVTTSIYDSWKTLGGLTLHVRRDAHRDADTDAALLLHVQNTHAQWTQRREASLPAGNYRFELIAKGNRFSTLAIDNVQLYAGACEQLGKCNDSLVHTHAHLPTLFNITYPVSIYM
jgi:hypothetical protein